MIFDLTAWLEEQKEYPKVFWREKGSSYAVAAVGALETTNSLPLSPKKIFFGACSFPSKKNGSEWKSYPQSYFFSPALFRREIESLSFPFATKVSLKEVQHLPNLTTWKSNVSEALEKIKKKEFEKVVLARRTTLQSKTLLNPFDIVRTLKAEATNTTIFLFQPNAATCFIGATPEHLYSRQDFHIRADALAGTASLGSFKGLYQEKELREFNYVKDFIQGKLAPLCTSSFWNQQDQIMTTSRMHHLYNCFSGNLRQIDDQRLLALLHPTPAMAGYPQAKSISYLQQTESFDRGWYAAPLGWITPTSATFALGIRSALITPYEMTVFAGTGIVEGSDAEKEWNELNLKTSHFYEV